jgi:hypothetical protein
MEMFLASVPNASRVVFIGDPNQIRPIPGEPGAGTPALDIAKAFPQHVIYLDQNMRQREDAKAIHDCVTAIRLHVPRSIVWGKTINDGHGNSDPVVLIEPNEQERNHSSQQFKERMFEIVERLRKNIHSEHDWQVSNTRWKHLGGFTQGYLSLSLNRSSRSTMGVSPTALLTRCLGLSNSMKWLICICKNRDSLMANAMATGRTL